MHCIQSCLFPNEEVDREYKKKTNEKNKLYENYRNERNPKLVFLAVLIC